MIVFGTLQEEVLCHLLQVSASWAMRAVYFFEAEEILVQRGVSHPQLEDGACCFSG
jgi:hypothetical protein